VLYIFSGSHNNVIRFPCHFMKQIIFYSNKTKKLYCNSTSSSFFTCHYH